jgi:hypothetical protein
MLLFTAIFLIIFEAVPEALALKGHKAIAGIIEGIYLAVVTISIGAWLMGYSIGMYGNDWRFILGGYLLMRFAIFDVVYNLIAGLPIAYIGTTKLSDKFWQWFFNTTKFPVGLFFGMLKFICFLIGLTWLITK